jgi:hypothetical protein
MVGRDCRSHFSRHSTLHVWWRSMASDKRTGGALRGWTLGTSAGLRLALARVQARLWSSRRTTNESFPRTAPLCSQASVECVTDVPFSRCVVCRKRSTCVYSVTDVPVPFRKFLRIPFLPFRSDEIGPVPKNCYPLGVRRYARLVISQCRFLSVPTLKLASLHQSGGEQSR